MNPHLANAPVSYGVWGPHQGPAGVSGAGVLQAIADAGYVGSELGPTGYLGDPQATAEAFRTTGLRAAGVYVGLRLAAGTLIPQDRAGLVAACRTLRATVEATRDGAGGRVPPAPVVLADDGAPELRDAPRDPRDRASGLDAAQWRAAAAVVAEAHRVVADHGLPTSFHPHLATFVESAWEVERLLESTDVGVTLDTGHLLLAGGDPVDRLRAWGSRVDHVHLKDVSTTVMTRARDHGPVPLRSWWARACVPLGAGDVDLGGVLAELAASGYAGWLVVEQDADPTGADLARFRAEQAGNLRTLRALLG